VLAAIFCTLFALVFIGIDEGHPRTGCEGPEVGLKE